MSDASESGRPPSPQQHAWLKRGLDQPGGKLPLFDEVGQQVDSRTVRSCIEQGWAEPWFDNPLKRDWLVCKLTESGRELAGRPHRVSTPRIKKRPKAIVIPLRRRGV